jgi:hypothetical protein
MRKQTQSLHHTYFPADASLHCSWLLLPCVVPWCCFAILLQPLGAASKPNHLLPLPPFPHHHTLSIPPTHHSPLLLPPSLSPPPPSSLSSCFAPYSTQISLRPIADCHFLSAAVLCAYYSIEALVESASFRGEQNVITRSHQAIAFGMLRFA